NTFSNHTDAVGFVGRVARIIKDVTTGENGLGLVEMIGHGNAGTPLQQRRHEGPADLSGATGNQHSSAGKVHQTATPRLISAVRIAGKLVMVAMSSADKERPNSLSIATIN